MRARCGGREEHGPHGFPAGRTTMWCPGNLPDDADDQEESDRS